MFDFALSQNLERRSWKRIFLSWAASCVVHLIALVFLIQFPELLGGSRYRAIPLIAKILGSDSNEGDGNWRTVAVLGDPSKMLLPSDATLRKYLYNWDKREPEAASVPVRWGDVKAAATDTPPMPRDQQEPLKADAGKGPGTPAAGNSDGGNDGASAEAEVAEETSAESEKKKAPPLPSPAPEPKTDIAAAVAPTKIPESIVPPPADTIPEENIKIFEDERNALHSADGGFFDTEGFPMGEYTNLIVERIKGKWLIPSNLRNSQGRTTVVFYIDREGRLMNARIVKPLGSTSLDRAALNAILESEPFPPLPEGFPGDHIGAKIIFSYNEPQ